MWLLQYHAYYPHQTQNIPEKKLFPKDLFYMCAACNYNSCHSVFVYVNLIWWPWIHAHDGLFFFFFLIESLHYFHFLILPIFPFFYFTLFGNLPCVTAAPSITVLPDCILLIPIGFLWLEEEWALLATELHLGVRWKILHVAMCVFLTVPNFTWKSPLKIFVSLRGTLVTGVWDPFFFPASHPSLIIH